MMLSESDLERFWSFVDRPLRDNTADFCWLWTGGTREGYGIFYLDGRKVSAHRLSYALNNNNEDIFRYMIVHTCKNKACVNPEHLQTGAVKNNNPITNTFYLSDEQVIDIRSRELTSTICKDLSKEFGLSPTYIKNVLEGKTYGWLGGGREVPPQFNSYKLSIEDVEEIKHALENAKHGDIQRLAKRYNVDRQTIANIKYRRRLYTEP